MASTQEKNLSSRWDWNPRRVVGSNPSQNLNLFFEIDVTSTCTFKFSLAE